MPAVQKRTIQAAIILLALLHGGAAGTQAQGEFPLAPQPRSVVVPGIMRLRIVQQGDNAEYVPQELGAASQFESAALYGTIGVLAHDYLSGRNFYLLKHGDRVLLTYGKDSDMRLQVWRVENVVEYYPSKSLSESEIFNKVYTHGGLVFQTCKGDGFLFVIARLEKTVYRGKK